MKAGERRKAIVSGKSAEPEPAFTSVMIKCCGVEKIWSKREYRIKLVFMNTLIALNERRCCTHHRAGARVLLIEPPRRRYVHTQLLVQWVFCMVTSLQLIGIDRFAGRSPPANVYATIREVASRLFSFFFPFSLCTKSVFYNASRRDR